MVIESTLKQASLDFETPASLIGVLNFKMCSLASSPDVSTPSILYGAVNFLSLSVALYFQAKLINSERQKAITIQA